MIFFEYQQNNEPKKLHVPTRDTKQDKKGMLLVL